MKPGNGHGSRPALLVLMTVAVGAFFTAEEVFMDLANGRGELASRDVVSGVEFWTIWIALVPAIAFAVRRWPLTTGDPGRRVASHAMAALVLAVVHNLIAFVLDSVVRYQRPGGGIAAVFGHRLVSQAFVWGIFTGVVFYAVVVMLYTALAFRAELAQVKLDTLRAQLRPHFLFNTLNAISVFVGEDTATARQMILRLSTLLRRSLDEEAHEVRLEEELAFAQDYLDIQRGRFGDRLAVALDVSPDAAQGTVPVFLLQPLLENAIQHGMTEDRPLSLTVRASRRDAALHLAVIDDGVGLDEDPTRRRGIGVANTQARLEQLYGRRACISWRSVRAGANAGGTRVDIELPYMEASP